jgi:hypothetical protein
MRIKNWNDFLLEKKTNIDKIKLFANQEEIYYWAFEQDEYLSIWLADQLVKLLKKRVKSDDLKRYLSGEKNEKLMILLEQFEE